MKNKIDIIIPVHNSAYWLSWCLDELFKYKPKNLGSIFVIDDRSSDDEAFKIEEITSRFSGVVLSTNADDKGGFGFSCNLGASMSKSDSILFLNTDCLVTEGVIDKLNDVINRDASIVMICPVSNNSPNYSYPIFPGRSYSDMAKLISDATSSNIEEYILEACTVVGNCLLVKRDFFMDAGGFSKEWGLGYGEETDLQMKAISMGKKGAVHLGCYVYHFGSGTFNYVEETEKLKKKNYELFFSKWKKEYKKLYSRCPANKQLNLISHAIDHHYKDIKFIDLDVLFYLPGIDQTIGGISAVISICNNLIRKGLRASCALVGLSANIKLKDYKEPILFNPLYYPTINDFLNDTVLRPKVVFSTIHTSSKVVAEFSEMRKSIPVQFVQGYEGYFENGLRYKDSKDSYKFTSNLVVTSSWLNSMVRRHLDDKQSVEILPLHINQDIFYTSPFQEKDIDILIVLRSAPDKGQWLLIEVIDRFVNLKFTITIICSEKFSFLEEMYSEKIKFIYQPLDHYSISRILRRVKVFLDLSSHEGFGLMPLEAAMCGAKVFTNDSGGVSDYILEFDGKYVSTNPDPSNLIDCIIQFLESDLKTIKNSRVKKYLKKNRFCVDIWCKYLEKISLNYRPPLYINTKEAFHDEIENTRKLHSTAIQQYKTHGFIVKNFIKLYKMNIHRIPPWFHQIMVIMKKKFLD